MLYVPDIRPTAGVKDDKTVTPIPWNVPGQADTRVLQASNSGDEVQQLFNVVKANQAMQPTLDPAAIISSINAQYPALDPYTSNLVIKYVANQGDSRQLEFYPPWEAMNPNAGKSTVEIYNNKLKGDELQRAIAGDLLHLVGSIDPTTGFPVDQAYYDLKQNFINSITPQQNLVDARVFETEKPLYKDNLPAFDDWMRMNRSDAYIRGYITPDAADEWRKQNVYTPDQISILDNIKQYLSTPKTKKK